MTSTRRLAALIVGLLVAAQPALTQYKPGGQTFDKQGRVLTIADEDGTSRRFEYDPKGSRAVWRGVRLIAVEKPDGSVLAFSYDAENKIGEARLTRPGKEPLYAKYSPPLALQPSIVQASLAAAPSTMPDLDPQPYAFAGEPVDPVTGLQYHRKRWYNPKTGQFTSPDPFEGVSQDPQTLHDYSYGHNDPVNNSDPTGAFADTSIGSLSVGMAGRGTLASTSVTNISAVHRVVAATLLVSTGIGVTVGPFMGGNCPPEQPDCNGRYWRLFRVMTSANPIECFMSSAELDLPAAGPEKKSPFIYEGVSMWDSLAGARSVVPKLESATTRPRTVYGIAELHIPYNTPGVFILSTFKAGHYTVRASPEILMKYYVREHPKQ